MAACASAILLGVFFAAMQILVLPPDGFVTGDQGSKFLQARAFADNGPLNPSIDVRARDIDPEYRRQEPKLKNRRGRLVSEFLWLLPLLSAPFLALFGMRGLYVVPALSVIVIFFAARALGRRLGDPGGLWTAWVVAIATPVLAYGLELWEHAPAAACVMVAAALVAPGARSEEGGARSEAGEGRSGGGAAAERWRLAAAGGLILAGALFREEVIVALPALLVGRALSLPRDRIRDLVATGVWMSIGAAIVFGASVPMNLLIYGAPLPMHVTQDAWEVAKNTPYLQVRREIVVDLFLPISHAALFVVSATAGLAAAMIAARQRRGGMHPGRGLVMVIHASAALILFIGVALPVWRLVQDVPPHEAYRVTSAAHTWPLLLAALYWPWVADAAYRPVARYLLVSAVLLLAGTAVLVPTSGGSQWSPRFFIAVAPLAAVVAAAPARVSPRGFRLQAEDPSSPVSSRGFRLQAEDPSSRATASVGWPARAIVLASILMQVLGVSYVQGAKARNARLTHWVASRTANGDVLITDVFWFHEVTATLAPTRRMLFSWSAADVPEMAAMAISRGLPRFGIVTATAQTGYDAPPTLDVPGAPCRFVRGQRVNLEETGVLLNRYACEER